VNAIPFARLSIFYCCYFGALGALVPYWGLYLDRLGFTAKDIGLLMACMMVTRIISPNLWGWLADRSGQRMRIIRFGTFFAAVGYAGALFGNSFWWLAGVMMSFSFFWHAVLPQFEAVTLNHLGLQIARYSHVRMWGSVGFILSAVGLGAVLDHFGLALLPYVIVMLMVGIWLSTLFVNDTVKIADVVEPIPLRRILARSDVRALLVVCVLMQASHGPYYTFYSLYLEQVGYSRTAIGQLWALGVVAEIVIFLYLHKLSRRFALQHLLGLSLALTTVRWLLIGLFPESLLLLLFAQCLHAASFGIYHAVAIQMVHGYFAGKHQGRGQALYSSLGFGAGGAIGSLFSGYLWASAGSTATFLVAAALSFGAWCVAWRYLKPTAMAI